MSQTQTPKTTPPGKTALTINLQIPQYTALQRICDDQGLTKIMIIRQALNAHLKAHYPEYLDEGPPNAGGSPLRF